MRWRQSLSCQIPARTASSGYGGEDAQQPVVIKADGKGSIAQRGVAAMASPTASSMWARMAIPNRATMQEPQQEPQDRPPRPGPKGGESDEDSFELVGGDCAGTLQDEEMSPPAVRQLSPEGRHEAMALPPPGPPGGDGDDPG